MKRIGRACRSEPPLAKPPSATTRGLRRGNEARIEIGEQLVAFDVFKLRDRVVGEYKDYVESFVHIYDKEIERFVHAKLDEGELWPDAVLQLNPAYEPGGTLGYRHQEEAIRAAARGGPVITSTGTGSGKSLTYLVPIVDHVLKNQPERHSVRVVVVYRMNALINSQLEALESFRKENWPECPVCFARYTGQDRDEARARSSTIRRTSCSPTTSCSSTC